ncbi:MAG: amino acid adenylation domain-containing protein, partial [Aurantibacter sp.]
MPQTFSLTQSQSLLWAGQKLNPDVPLYNVPYAFEIFGAIDEPCFKEAFQILIDKVDVLRTIFRENNGVPQQSTLPDFKYELETIRRDKDVDRQETDLWLLNRSKRIFDLSNPLFDSALLDLGENRFIWFLNVHHLITDALSSTIIFETMSKIYGLLKRGEAGEIKERPSYLEYIEYELAEKTSDLNKNARAHWKQKTSSFGDVPKLYGNKAKQGTTRSRRISVKLGVHRTKRIKEIAQLPELRMWTQHLTIFNLLSTLVFVYLYRISGQKKLVLGAPINNRSSQKFRSTAGLFMEIFPISAELSEQDTFKSVFERIRTECGEYLKYGHSGMASAEISRSFNTVFNYIHSRFPDFDGFPSESKWIHPGHSDPAHHMRCHVYDMDGEDEMNLVFDLNEEIFDNRLAQQVPDHFLNLFDALLDDIDMEIEKPPIITNEEIAELVPQLSHSRTKFISILEKFETTANRYPNAVSIQYGNQTLTYRDLNNKANKLARYLVQKGIGKEVKVALLLSRSIEYILGMLAVIKAGGTFIPISSDNPEDRVAFIVSDSECALLLTEERLMEKAKSASVPTINLESESNLFDGEASDNLGNIINPKATAYVLYTSGSTGNPKGVLISHYSLSNYLSWAHKYYDVGADAAFPLFTSIGFDLTLTSTFLPLLSGGRLLVYREPTMGPDISLLQVIEENLSTHIKLTPSHLALLSGRDLKSSHLRTMIVGGEDFKVHLAKSIQAAFGEHLEIFNEYGPTEATVGCITAKFDRHRHTTNSVPIGEPIENMKAYILDRYHNPVPRGVVGELYVAGAGLAQGYVKLPEFTAQKFVKNPFELNTEMYYTGDLARVNDRNEFEYLGRADEQIKLRGHRIELADIESNLMDHTSVHNCAVVLLEDEKPIPENEVVNCNECGLPSNYPDADFDAHGVCNLCNAFKDYKSQVNGYFKSENELRELLISKRDLGHRYDCISLLSGGKDSTYILARLIDMGLRVLAFTLDNGYISEQAKENIDQMVKKLGVDHIYGNTAHMNEIFVDSLKRHQNVCNGCFKTIYTLSTQIALEKQIPFVVTGLSRGQLFETRLTEELFWDQSADAVGTMEIDATILEARKLYHQEEDAVKSLLDVSVFAETSTFEKVQFVDFYRYSDVSLEQMLEFLEEKVEWVRPTDTGRSTNCLINQVGIYVHKEQKGYSNYSFPYSWDVRLGHKTRSESLEEVNEVIDEPEVFRIMNEIGYEGVDTSFDAGTRLVGYYTGDQNISSKELRRFLGQRLPSYMVPSVFKHLEEMPLTKNG